MPPIFKGRTTVEVLRNIYEDTSIRLWGKIKNHEVTALNCFIHDSECWTDKSDNFGEVSITLCPSEIIIGRCFENEIHVKEISMEIPSLNYMFPNNNLLDHLPTKDNPSILGFSFPAALVAEDKYGKLSVHRHLSMSSSIGERKHTIIPRVEYNFDNQMPMREAISRVAAARNFFSFFANHFIPLGFIEFSDSYKECGLIINHDEMIDSIHLHSGYVLSDDCKGHDFTFSHKSIKILNAVDPFQFFLLFCLTVQNDGIGISLEYLRF